MCDILTGIKERNSCNYTVNIIWACDMVQNFTIDCNMLNQVYESDCCTGIPSGHLTCVYFHLPPNPEFVHLMINKCKTVIETNPNLKGTEQVEVRPATNSMHKPHKEVIWHV